jgi:ABC-type molybdenum transport system ATPase subunit/photorepair protein PhrA
MTLTAPEELPLLNHGTNLTMAMRKTPVLRSSLRSVSLVQIENGTFYRHHPNSNHGLSSSNPALFKNLHFTLPSFSKTPEYWSIIGPSSSGKTTFLQILRSQHLCIPPTARSYPYLTSEEIRKKDHRLSIPTTAIKHVGFDGEQGLGAQAPQSAYLSARYESRREDTDFSVRDYLQGNTELNPSQDAASKEIDRASLERVIKDLRLGDLADMPVSNLSNGQTRRARIARALLSNPEVLLLDEPFMGLDPPTLLTLSPLLQRLAEASAPRLVLSLRPQDPIPDWITHVMYLKGSCEIAFHGKKEDVLLELRKYAEDVKAGKVEADLHMPVNSMAEVGRRLTENGVIEPPTAESSTDKIFMSRSGIAATDSQQDAAETVNVPLSRDGYPLKDNTTSPIGEALVEMSGAVVTYGHKSVLGNWEQTVNNAKVPGLYWTIKRGERWGIFGPNGSGKTTILSLICSDHPQTYSLPITLFGRSRLPEPGRPGISIFDIQARIGHSSPEIHNHMPKSLSLRQVLENAWSDTFRGVPKLDEVAREKVDACLRWFEDDLRPGGRKEGSGTSWADEFIFGGLPFSSQRVALFLRAVIKHPDLVILDEAFSGMDEGVRDRCLLFLAHGETKQFSYTSTSPTSSQSSSSQTETGISKQRHRAIIPSNIFESGEVKVGGLYEDQALLCISHIREEIPGSIREWICLPEANTRLPARFGRLDGPIEGDYKRWGEIWGM